MQLCATIEHWCHCKLMLFTSHRCSWRLLRIHARFSRLLRFTLFFVTFHISSAACLLSLFQLISTWFARQMQQHKMKTSFEHRSIIYRELSCDREIFWALLSMWHEARTAVQHVCSLVMNWCCYTIIFTINSNCITVTLLWRCASQRPSFRSRFLTLSSQFIAVSCNWRCTWRQDTSSDKLCAANTLSDYVFENRKSLKSDRS